MFDIITVNKALEWYKGLDIDKKIQLKNFSHLICGIEWTDFSPLFNIRERIIILYSKLVSPGIIKN
ncbi:MAG: hypothetical protein HPY57_13050 [Ignavibacteria bacterium]|nr:hypothetical protein [Ignavibacteria bacterium]